MMLKGLTQVLIIIIQHLDLGNIVPVRIKARVLTASLSCSKVCIISLNYQISLSHKKCICLRRENYLIYKIQVVLLLFYGFV